MLPAMGERLVAASGAMPALAELRRRRAATTEEVSTSTEAAGREEAEAEATELDAGGWTEEVGPAVLPEIRLLAEPMLVGLQRVLDAALATQAVVQERKVLAQQRCIDAEWSRLQARERELDARQEELAAREARLQRELASYQGGRALNDVLKLNIAGEAECAVLRSTLCLVQDSMLASRFSGRWDEAIEKDDDGRFFIDFPPDLFLPLLDFLRQKSIALRGDDVTLPRIPEERLLAFNRMANYYGVDCAVHAARALFTIGIDFEL